MKSAPREEETGLRAPPFPHPDNTALKLIVLMAAQAHRSGEATVEGAILNAAVNAWYEGHVEGEDHCPGCTFRGDRRFAAISTVSKRRKGWKPPWHR